MLQLAIQIEQNLSIYLHDRLGVYDDLLILDMKKLQLKLQIRIFFPF